MFVPESGEKPVTVYHRLKLHPWHPVTIRATEAGPGIANEAPPPSEQEKQVEDAVTQSQPSADENANSSQLIDASLQAEKPSFISPAQVPPDQTDAAGSTLNYPPVVHSWAYDEVVFPEPTEAFYEILLANPPTP